MKKIYLSLTTFLTNGDERTLRAKKNIFTTVFIKGGSILINLLLVPLIITCITPAEYGIWLTLSSLIGWMSFFDVGLGNGLRNKLAECLALNEVSKGKSYVSTTYATLSLISIFLIVFFLVVNPHLPWIKILNAPESMQKKIYPITLIVLCTFCFQFVLQLINTILTAAHTPSKASLITFLGQLFVIISIIILKNTGQGRLEVLVSVLTIVPVVVTAVSSLYLFSTDLKKISPSFENIELKYAKGLVNNGSIFFVIQIGALILFQTDNIIISRVIGPEAVTTFNVSYKLFSVIIMVFTIIITPYWSAFTDAYVKDDFLWIRKSIRMIRTVFLILSILALVVFFLSNIIYKVWLGEKILVDNFLSFAMMVYVIIYMWQAAHVQLLNGIGKIRLQLILVVSSAVINIPLAIVLGRYWGLPGIISANTFVFMIMSIFFYVQSEKIIGRSARGIWNK